MKTCPACNEETIMLTATLDGDGDGVYTRSFWTPEISEQGCGCQLTPEQVDQVLDQFDPGDWNDYDDLD